MVCKILNIQNIGSLNPDGSVKSSISGFMKSGTTGGFILNNGIVNIENSVISSNTISGTNTANGGAVFVGGTGKLNVTDSVFIDNQAVGNTSKGSGGAIYHNGGTTTIKNSIFQHNRTGDNDADRGGAIYVVNGILNLIADDGITSFQGNYVNTNRPNAIHIVGSSTLNLNVKDAIDSYILFDDAIAERAIDKLKHAANVINYKDGTANQLADSNASDYQPSHLS